MIVHLYEEFGPQCLEKLRGMFAFAIWDENTKTLFLARDRVGIKPLYYCLTDTSLVFASEIKAILADPSINREIAPEVIDRFLTFLYVPGEETLLKGIRKLAPGHYLLIKDGKPVIEQYWDLRFAEPTRSPSLADAEADLLSLLAETVELHMIADVPVGVLLSGGVDSTGVLSFAVDGTDKEISSFTVGFSGGEVADERPYARLAAETFGTQHHEMTISAEDFAAFLPKYVWHMEEPVCEPPAIALVLRLEVGEELCQGASLGRRRRRSFCGVQQLSQSRLAGTVETRTFSAERRRRPGTFFCQLALPLASSGQVCAVDERSVSPTTTTAGLQTRIAILETDWERCTRLILPERLIASIRLNPCAGCRRMSGGRIPSMQCSISIRRRGCPTTC